MLPDVIEVQARQEHKLWLKFDDGVVGEVDLVPMLTFQGVFAPLRDPDYFGLVKADPELGTVAWPNGADFDPLVLYSLVSGRPLEELLAESSSVG